MRRVLRLVRLAYNLRWSWEPRAARLFAALGPDVWRASHNPVAVLRYLTGDDTTQLTANAAAIDEACSELEQYLEAEQDRSHEYGGRQVSGLAEPARKGQLALFPQDPRRAGMR